MCLTNKEIQCIEAIDPIFSKCQDLLGIRVSGGYKKLTKNSLNRVYGNTAYFNTGLNANVNALPIFSGGFYSRQTDTVYFDFDNIYHLIKMKNQKDLKITILHEVRHSYQKHEIDLMNSGQKTNEPLTDVKSWNISLGNNSIEYLNSSSEFDAIQYSNANYNKV